MATSVQQRAAQRGFPVFDYAGMTGQGALQDATALPASAGLPDAPYTNPNTDPGSVPASLPQPEEYQLGLTLWGLSGSLNPDNTPRTHAAPFADPAALAVGDAEGTHDPTFNGYAIRNPGSSQSEVGTQAFIRQGRNQGQGSGETNLQPITGQIRSNAGYDAVQGYGGGGPGPGGVNTPQGPTTDDMTFDGETYHNVMVSTAETEFLSPAATQFIVSAPEFPAYAPSFDVPTASVRTQAIIPTDTPAQGPPVGSGADTYASSFWS